MGKRSNFKRNPRDYYPTPMAAVEPLAKHLQDDFVYCEPCAGDGALIRAIKKYKPNSRCYKALDIQPQSTGIEKGNAFDLDKSDLPLVDYIITNPPWDVKILHPMIVKFSILRPTWLLFYADWMHAIQASEHLKYCEKIVSVGRVKWIEGSKHTGKDNCAWYLFNMSGIFDKKTETIFVGR